MADSCANCADCRTWEEEIYWNRFHSFYFCQKLSSVRDFHSQLEIPKKFAENVKAVLPSKVTLRGPSRISWCAATMNKEDGLFFTDGWEEFVMAYSLQANDILIFQFDRVSAFDVLIFDGQTLCEKETAYFVKKCGHVNAKNQKKRTSSEAGIEDHVDVDDDGDGFIHRTAKQSREEAAAAAAVNGNATPKRSSFSVFNNAVKKKRSLNSVSSKSKTRKRIPSAENGEYNGENELQIIEANGPCPTEAPNSNIPSETNGSPASKPPSQDTPHCNGATLPEATPRRVASARGRPRKRTGAFSRTPGSSVGRQRKNKVVDTPLRSPSSGRLRCLPEEGKSALEVARRQTNENDFLVVMHPTTVCKRYILALPPAWCRKHIPPKCRDVFLRFGDETFLTRLSYTPRSNTGQICGGWKKVVAANELRLYDVCVFKIASKTEDSLMLDVIVSRAAVQMGQPSPLSPVE